MSLWKIAWRSIQQRALASALTAVSMALGVALVVAVLVILSVVRFAFHRGGEGYDLIVGAAKGSRMELVLSSVYFIGQPVENLPYSYYKELSEGKLSSSGVLRAIPICLGDSYGDFRVVATVPDMFDELTYLDNRKYQFAQGVNFREDTKDEAVVGATVARKMGMKLGSTFRPSHDVAGKATDDHPPFRVVGILAATGTPVDRAIFISLEGFYSVAGHLGHSPAEDKDDQHGSKSPGEATSGHDGHGASHDTHAAEAEPEKGRDASQKADRHHDHPVPDELKKVSAVLLVTDEQRLPGISRILAKQINDDRTAQAAIPADEISRLFENIIGNVELVLLVFAVVIVIVAGIGIMVSIYNSMSDRRHEIAIMRSLGASRQIIMLVILLESIMLSLGGGAMGLILGHGLIGALSPTIAEQTGVTVGLLEFQWLELVLIPGLVALASVVGYLPAVAAYRTDVARSLMANP